MDSLPLATQKGRNSEQFDHGGEEGCQAHVSLHFINSVQKRKYKYCIRLVESCIVEIMVADPLTGQDLVRRVNMKMELKKNRRQTSMYVCMY
jgi:hypothetical protein